MGRRLDMLYLPARTRNHASETQNNTLDSFVSFIFIPWFVLEIKTIYSFFGQIKLDNFLQIRPKSSSTKLTLHEYYSLGFLILKDDAGLRY